MRTLTKFKKYIVLRDLRLNFISSIDKSLFVELHKGTKFFLFLCVMLFSSFSFLALAEDNEGIPPLLNNETPADPAFIFTKEEKTCCLCILGNGVKGLCSDNEDSRFSNYLSQDGIKCDVKATAPIIFFNAMPTYVSRFVEFNRCTNIHTYYAGHSSSGINRPYSPEDLAALFQSCPGGKCSFRDLGCNGGNFFANKPITCNETQGFISVMCEGLKKGEIKNVVTVTANQTQVMDGHHDQNSTIILEVSYSPGDPDCSSKIIFPNCSSMAKKCNPATNKEFYFCMENNQLEKWRCTNMGSVLLDTCLRYGSWALCMEERSGKYWEFVREPSF